MSGVIAWVLNKALAPFNGIKTYLGLAGSALVWLFQTGLPWLTTNLPSVAAFLPSHVLSILATLFHFLTALGFAHGVTKAQAAAALAAQPTGRTALLPGTTVPAPTTPIVTPIPAATLRIAGSNPLQN